MSDATLATMPLAELMASMSDWLRDADWTETYAMDQFAAGRHDAARKFLDAHDRLMRKVAAGRAEIARRSAR